MPSIQQIIAEIQLSPDLPAHHITKAVQIIRDAEQRLKLKRATGRPRKASGKGLMTLQEWEAKYKPLSPFMLSGWIDEKKLCERMVGDMIDEFCGEMIAKGKQYANFKAAFMTYLAKGYLSKRLDACTLEKSKYKTKTTISQRGIEL